MTPTLCAALVIGAMLINLVIYRFVVKISWYDSIGISVLAGAMVSFLLAGLYLFG